MDKNKRKTKSFIAPFDFCFVSSDHQDTATTERFSSVKETTKEKETPQEEDEEEDVEKKDKIENSRGCN